MKADFCFKWIESINDLDELHTKEDRRNFLLNLICFAACIEGLFFFAAFAYVYYLRSKGLLQGLATGTNWVFRDESCHMKFAFEVVDTVSAKDLWQRILEMRMQTGEPYIHFIDTSNEQMPTWLKQRGLEINQSNLCSEIILPTNKDRTAVCCLSSLNLEYYDTWSKDKQFIGDVAEMLDNVLTFFIDNAPTAIERAKYSAQRERSIGLGALGYHAYLQRKGVPFESTAAKSLNIRLFRHIRKKMDEANLRLAKERGEAPDAKGTGFRFSHVMAIAPNASSSIIMGNTSVTYFCITK